MSHFPFRTAVSPLLANTSHKQSLQGWLFGHFLHSFSHWQSHHNVMDLDTQFLVSHFLSRIKSISLIFLRKSTRLWCCYAMTSVVSDMADPASGKHWGKSGGSAPPQDPYSSHAHQWACLSMGKTSVVQLISALMKEVVILSEKTQKIYSNNFNRTSDWRAQRPGCWSPGYLQTWIFQIIQIFKVFF